MTTTLDALNSANGASICFVAIIEGYSYALTDGDPAAVLAAVQAGPTGHAGITDCIEGLSVMWDQRDSANPWKPVTDTPSLRMSVTPGRNVAGAVVDTFGRDVFRRTVTSETYLAGTIDNDDGLVTVASTAAFAGAGVVHIGGEAIAYSATAATTFTVSQRAVYSPFQTSTGAPMSRRHDYFNPATQAGDGLGVHLQPVASSEPRNGLVGRAVGVWILLKQGASYTSTTNGHLAFAGIIAEADEDGDGATLISVEEIRRKIFETPLLRDQYRATIQEGLSIVTTGARIECLTTRQVSVGGTTVGTANPLTVVSGAPASAAEIQAGIYTAAELGTAIQAWLDAERAASRILFNVRYTAAIPTDGGLRPVFELDDSTATSGLFRQVVIKWQARLGHFLGWGEEPHQVLFGSATSTARLIGPAAPLRAYLHRTETGVIYDIGFTNPTGTWINQLSLMPASTTMAGEMEGVLRFGSYGYVVAHRIDDETFQYADGLLDGYLPATGLRGLGAEVTLDDEGDLEVRQVIFGETPFKTLLLSILSSTGTLGYNHPSYDSLPESLGCGIPWSLLGTDFEADVNGLAQADRLCRFFIEKPTRFSDLFETDLQLRWAFLTWQAGRLNMRSWTTPVASFAEVALTEESKAVPASSAQGDTQRSESREEVESIYNSIKISYDRDPDGNYVSTLEVADAPSIRDHGARPLTIEARNVAPTDAVELLSAYSSGLALHTRPRRVIRRSLARQYFEQVGCGTVVTLTDRHIRAPDTGLRWTPQQTTGGLIGWPGIVVGLRFDWGGSESSGVRQAHGEVDIMIYDRIAHAPYSPCAQVDDTQANAGYNAGTGALTCYAHEHSESTSPTADAANFEIGDRILIVEIDPLVAASPLSWARTISTVAGNVITPTATLSAPAWDATKKYRIVSSRYTSAQATQRTDCYQADDADMLVADLRQPYGLIFSGAGQSSIFTLSPSTELPARYATTAAGDGRPYDTGYDRDIARGMNNLIDYKTAPQAPAIRETADTFAGTGTWELARCRPYYFGPGLLIASSTINAEIAPFLKSTDGSSASVRVTLSKFAPGSATRNDVVFFDPYVQATFTTTATSNAIPTKQDLGTGHLNRSSTAFGGWGWISIEVTAKASSQGVGHLRIGPRT